MMNHPAIELVSPADLDRARVALVIAEAADEATIRVVGAIQRDGIPKVILVAAHFDERGVVLATAAGVTNFVRRVDATSNRLADVLVAVAPNAFAQGMRRMGVVDFYRDWARRNAEREGRDG